MKLVRDDDSVEVVRRDTQYAVKFPTGIVSTWFDTELRALNSAKDVDRHLARRGSTERVQLVKRTVAYTEWEPHTVEEANECNS